LKDKVASGQKKRKALKVEGKFRVIRKIESGAKETEVCREFYL
jgi:hypothetical protein